MAKKTAKKVASSVTVTKKEAPKAAAMSKASTGSAGRPKGSGRYGCETKAVRIPVHMVEEIKSFILKKLKADTKNK